MSGRLIITEKKSYCPWAPQNIERVLRDERLERERIEKEKQRETQARMDQLKKQKESFVLHPPEETHHDSTTHKFFNLFEAEEKERMIQVSSSFVPQEEDRRKTNPQSIGIMPVFLVSPTDGKNHEFFVRKYYMERDKDDELKNRMDPMRSFRKEQHELGLLDVDKNMTQRQVENTNDDLYSSTSRRVKQESKHREIPRNVLSEEDHNHHRHRKLKRKESDSDVEEHSRFIHGTTKKGRQRGKEESTSKKRSKTDSKDHTYSDQKHEENHNDRRKKTKKYKKEERRKRKKEEKPKQSIDLEDMQRRMKTRETIELEREFKVLTQKHF